MTRFIHDRFGKEFLEELLSIGTVNIGRDVTSEVREIDVYFTPGTAIPEYSETLLGLLGKMASTTAIFEPFRNPANASEICSCLNKSLDVRGELERQSRRENTRCDDERLPKLWILVPTASKALLDGFNAKLDTENWMQGIYFLGESWRSAIVVIHQLPETPETLWLRILSTLPTDDPLRMIALELLYRLQSNLVTDIPKEMEPEERELIMADESGREQAVKLLAESVLKMSVTNWEDILPQAVSNLLALPVAELTLFVEQLPQLSDGELRERLVDS